MHFETIPNDVVFRPCTYDDFAHVGDDLGWKGVFAVDSNCSVPFSTVLHPYTSARTWMRDFLIDNLTRNT